MVSVADSDRDVLRFLWIKDVKGIRSEIVVMRFTRVVFGVSASPFHLNATIDHHIKKYELTDRPFVEKFRRSIYVDDLTVGSHDMESAYEFYIKSKVRLAEASFNLRKFDTNSPELRQRINYNERILCQGSSEESPSEAQSQWSDLDPGSAERQVLGVNWNVISDELIFDIGDVCRHQTN